MLAKRSFFLYVALLGILFNVFSIGIMAQTTPMTVGIQGVLSTPAEGLIGSRYPGKSVRKDVRVEIYSGSTATGWTQTFTGVTFVNGAFSILLGKTPALSAASFRVADPRFAITVDNVTAFIPIASAPYAIQASSAETVRAIDASVISGSFINTVNVSATVNIRNGTFFVNPNTSRVGIGTTLPGYLLDVNGFVNAAGYLVNGVDLESAFAWNKQGDSLYYNEGNVGVGTSSPAYSLDVVGTLNATVFMENGVELSQRLKAELAWQSGPGNDIYFDDGVLPNGGYVGIGTTAPLEKLDVRGAIRVGATTRPLSPQPGTIQYVVDLSTQLGDFLGYNGSEWVSLTGIRGSGVSGNLTFWTGEKTLSGSNMVYWNGGNMLGVGTNLPQSRLHVRGTSSVGSILNVENSSGTSLLYVGSSNVGIGTTAPSAKLDVNGYVNAAAFQIGGKPIEFALSADSYWLLENFGRIFYDKGSVGIGTSAPINLLELASVTGSAAMTFDIAGQNLFTMGIDSTNPEAFIIGKGGDLSVPVFTFKNANIGVGVSEPKANLHVSGNSGMIVSGIYGSGEGLSESGPGAKLIWYPNKAAFRVGYAAASEWDQASLGDFSVAMGYNSLASGFASAALGGYRGKATGRYAVSVGGRENDAIGDYSVAIGHMAKANHTGSFVWADYIPTSNTQSFASSAANQFLIRAQNGVGIGTTDTSRSSLTVVNTRENEYLFRAQGSGTGQFVVTTSGNVGIGTSTPGTAGLALMGGGRMGVGTTTPQAMVTVYPTAGSTANLVVFKAANVNYTSLLISPSGNVGIGVTEGYDFSDTDDRLVVVGGIKASEFKMVDPNDPNQTITIQPNPGSPWADPSKNDNNTHRTQGFVGIGTPSPNSLLELSNRNASGDVPVITFDINGDDKYSLGVATPSTAADTYLFTIQSGGALGTTPSLVVATSSVGIGIGRTLPSAALHVSGDAIVLGSMAVGTSNMNPLYRLNVGGALNAEQVYIGGVRFQPAESPWKTQGANIYYNSGYVGIGTSAPAYPMDVVGSIRATDFILSNDLVFLENNFTADRLFLKDVVFSDPAKFGQVFVENAELKYTNSDGLTKVINSPLQKGIGTNGRLAYFVDDSTVGQTDVVWNGTQPQLQVSGNMLVSRYFNDGGFIADSRVFSGYGHTGLGVATTLNYTGVNDRVRSYTAQDIAVNVSRDWGNNKDVSVKGLNIALRSDPDSKLFDRAQAVGLNVDVSGIALGGNGQKYAAIFLGGNVGIGTSMPSTELEVVGTVSANYFNVSGGLTVSGSAALQVPSLVISGGGGVGSTFVGRSVLQSGRYLPRIGIGISNPEEGNVELAVNGVISANRVTLSGGLTAATVNIANNGFVIDASGNIGIGTSRPNGQIEIYRNVSGTQTQDLISQKMSIVIDGASPDSQFYLRNNLTGVNVAMRTASSDLVVNRLNGNATGVKIDLSDLALQNQSKAVGLDVDVTGSSGTRYAAIFKGGYVGIGTTTPEADLHVSGNIKAVNLILQGVLQSDSATFNNLVVNKHVTVNGVVTVNSLVVEGTLTTNTLVLLSSLQAPNAVFNGIVSNTASINGLLTADTMYVRNQFFANQMTVTAGVGIGTNAPASGLAVSGDVVLSSVQVNDRLSLTNATLNVNNATLFVSPYSDRVGINTGDPLGALHVVSYASSAYDPQNYLTWNPLVLQNKSYTSGTATGILFLPDGAAPTPNSGSGILGVRATGSAAETASYLAFITDPQSVVGLPSSGISAERMRITAAGNVGIGTQSPAALLHVAGGLLVDQSATINGTLSVGTLTANGDLSVAPTGVFLVNGLVSANAGVRSQSLQFLPVASQASSAAYGQLYVDKTSLDLFYLKPGSSSPFNISVAHSGAPNKVPFFDASGNLSDGTQVYWNAGLKQLQIGTANVLASTALVATFNTTDTGAFTGQTISLGFANRSDSVNGASFTGLAVNLEGQSGTSFGRLAPGEKAVGLAVDVSKLAARQFTADNLQVGGIKYAAAFTGGSVGVGTSAPEAALHVRSETAGTSPFRVDTNLVSNVFVVDASGRVGVGTGNASTPAQLTVVGQSGVPGLQVLSSTGVSQLMVNASGMVGIGTSSPTSLLHVAGIASANTGVFSGLSVATINVGRGAFVVDASGNIGIGTTQPAGNIAFSKQFTPDNVGQVGGSGFVSQVMNLGIGVSQSDTQFFYRRDLTGIQVALGSDSSAAFLGDADQNTPTVSATGVSINMSALTLAADAKAVGLDVDVTGTAGTRYAALFMGGNVGIGVSEPSVALHVSGDIRASSAYLSGSVSAQSVTVNRLTVTGPALFSGTVTVNNLMASVISANRVLLQKELVVATGSFSTINATSQAYFGKLGIGVTLPSVPLQVSGNTQILGTLTASALQTNAIQSSGALGITASTLSVSGTMNVASDLYMAGGLYLSPISGTPVPNNTTGIAYVDSAGDFRYQYPDGSLNVNISKAFSGASGRIPYFGADGSLTTTPYLNWDNASQSLKVGTANAVTTLEVASTINTSTVGDIAGQRIKMNFGDRSLLTGQASVFTGLDVRFQSENLNDPNTFGRLASGETVVGLDVDVRNLRAPQVPNGSFKYAAVFRGGNVGIGTTRPEAALHILDENGNMPLKVDLQTTKNVLVVTPAGLVGVGTSAPSSVLTVVGGSTPQSAIFEVKDSTSASRFVVRGDGKVGVGTTAPSVALEVVGTVSANQGLFSSLVATTANIGNNAFVVNASGNVGIGTSAPAAGLHMYKALTSSVVAALNGSTYTGEKSELSIGTEISDTTFRFSKDLVGMQVALSSVGSTFGDAASTSTLNATGLAVDMSGLTLANAQAKATGLYVDVTGTGGSRYAGIFMGGGVGIGTSTPRSALQVSGDIRATSLYLSGDMLADDVTTNRLTVLGSALFSGPVTANTIIADTVSANNIVLTGTFTVSTGAFSTVNATVGNFTRLGVGVANPTQALDVSGNVGVSGNMYLQGLLTVSTINSQTSVLTLSSTSGVYVSGNMTVSNNVRMSNGGLYFVPQSTVPASDLLAGGLYAGADGHLNYLRPNSTSPITLTKSLIGTPGVVPYYDASGNLSSSANLQWDLNLGRLVVGTANKMTSFEVYSTVPNTAGASYAAQSIQMQFGNRASLVGSSSTMTGLDIAFLGQNPTDANSFGRLAKDEEGIGLRVDMRQVRGRYSTDEALSGDANLNGFKYAGLFLGGNVGIGTSSPKSSVHVVSEVSTVSPFRVDATAADYALFVSGNGRVGVGTSEPTARLAVRGDTSDSTAFAFLVRNSASSPVFAVRNDGRVGVGTTSPTATLTVSGNIPFAVSVPNNQNALYMNNSGLLGINQNAPTSLLDVVGTSTVSPLRVGISGGSAYALYVAPSGFVGMGISAPKNRLHVDGIVQSGTENALVPSWIQTLGNGVKGYLAGTTSNAVFLGMASNGTSYDSVMTWDTANLKFQFSDGATRTTVATLVGATGGSPKMGIGTVSPSANLHVTSNLVLEPVFRVDAFGKLGSVVVSGNGFVGINTLVPSYNLDVAGDMRVTSLLSVPTATITTATVTGYLSVAKAITTPPTTTLNAQSIQVTLNNYTQANLVGLNINMSSATNPDLGTPYAVFNAGRATGLFVDVSSLSVLNPSGPSGSQGYKYSGIFLGGAVGIGTSSPQATLQVATTLTDMGNGTYQGDVARFGSGGGDVTIRDYDSGRVGFVVRNSNTNTSYLSLVLAAGSGSDTVGRVGIGVSNPDKTLVVNGDMRVGTRRDSLNLANSSTYYPETTQRYGNRLYFNGGPDVSGTYDNENNAPMWIGRYNASSTSSDLRINVGNQTSGSQHRFVVGTGGAGNFKSVLTVEMTGKVGISDLSLSEVFAPKTVLHVLGGTTATGEYIENHVMAVENRAGSGGDALALQFTTASIDDSYNFVSFFNSSSTWIGGIKSNASGTGVQFVTGGADYAEYLEKQNPAEVIKPGDVVGVVNGKISKNTAGAQIIMVHSTSPSIAGNKPAAKDTHKYALVAFLGQVPVRVNGAVRVGDYLIPSGQNDGTAVAVAPDKITPAQRRVILGTAWESASGTAPRTVKTAVGFAFDTPSYDQEMAVLSKLKEDVQSLKKSHTDMVKQYEEKFAAQDKELDRLLQMVKEK